MFSSIVGGVSAVGGLISGSKAAKSANKASERQADVAKAQLDFTKEQYDDWKAIYGDVEKNLSTFYNNLTPQYFTAQGLQAYEQEFQKNQTELNEFFAVHDISTDVQADLETKMGLQGARDRAQIRADAPFKVADEQNKFLAVGTGQKGALLGNVTTASGALSNVYGNQSAIARNSANVGFQAASSGLGVLAEGIDDGDFSTSRGGSFNFVPTAAGGRTEIG